MVEKSNISGNNTQLGKGEEQLLSKCLIFIETQGINTSDPTTKEENQFSLIIDPEYIKRFYEARDGDLEKAYLMWENWVKWRLTYKPNNIDLTKLKYDLSYGKSFIHGNDKEGRPCLLLFTGLHFPDKTTFDNSYSLGVYWMERMMQTLKSTYHKNMVVIVDQSDAGWSNVDYPIVKHGGIVTMLQDYYPERLHKILIINMNFIIRQVLNLAKNFMSHKTSSRIEVLSSVKELKQYFNDDQLLPQHGGKSTYKYEPPQI